MNNKQTALRFGTQAKPQTDFRLVTKTNMRAGYKMELTYRGDSMTYEYADHNGAQSFCKNYGGSSLQWNPNSSFDALCAVPDDYFNNQM